jgi:hypothetical protein
MMKLLIIAVFGMYYISRQVYEPLEEPAIEIAIGGKAYASKWPKTIFSEWENSQHSKECMTPKDAVIEAIGMRREWHREEKWRVKITIGSGSTFVSMKMEEALQWARDEEKRLHKEAKLLARMKAAGH